MGVRTLCPPSGSAHGTGLCLDLLRYTEYPFHRAHRLLYDTLRTFYRSTRRERERERCVFFLNFVILFNSESSSTYFKDSCISLQKILIDEMSLSECIHYKRHLRRWRASEKRFGFLKEERKGSDLSVVRGYISGLLRLVSKLSAITCTCLALDLAITARAGHFTDSLGG